MTQTDPLSRAKPLPHEPYDRDNAILDDEVSSAAQFLTLLLRGIKNLKLYIHAHERYASFLRPAWNVLQTFGSESGALPLKLGPEALFFRDTIVYEEKGRENLTYGLYKDGVRYLIFHPGITIDELLRFVLLYIDQNSEQEGTALRIWKEEFKYIEHIVIDNFSFDEFSEEETQLEVDKIIGYLRSQLEGNNKDITRFARLSLHDLELELSTVEQIRGGIISGRTATENDKSRIQDTIVQEEKDRVLGKVTNILFQTLELEAKPYDQVPFMEAIVQILDLLLVSDRLGDVALLMRRFDDLGNRPLTDAKLDMIRIMRLEFRRKMVEPQRLSQLGQYLKLSKHIDIDASREYLQLCGQNEMLALIDMLIATEQPEAKKLLIDVLSHVGRREPGFFSRYLDHNASAVVRDILAVIQKIDPTNKIEVVSRCLKHPNIMIRLEGLKIMAQSRGSASLRYIENALKDDDIQMRLGAIRALTRRSPRRATLRMIEFMQAADFFRRERRERLAAVTSLGESQTPEALEYLSGLFRQRAWLFNRAKVLEFKLLGVNGLRAMRTRDAFHVLNAEIKNRRHPREVLEACHRAAFSLKEYFDADSKNT